MAALGEDFNCHDPAPITEKKIPDSSFNCVQTIVLKLIYVWKMGHKDHQDSLESTNYLKKGNTLQCNAVRLRCDITQYRVSKHKVNFLF